MPPGNLSIVMKTDAVDGAAHDYRLAKITEIQKEIERERDKRAGLNEKYRKGIRLINVVDGISGMVALGSTASAIAVMSTIVAAPIAMALQAVTFGAGVFVTVGRVVNRKLNTISNYVSKALEDGYISNEEYSLILNELGKFNEMKEEIRNKTKVSIDEEPGNRETMIESFENVLGKSTKT